MLVSFCPSLWFFSSATVWIGVEGRPPTPNAVSHTTSGTCLAQSASADCRVSLQVSPIFILEKITLCWAWGLILTTQHLAGQAEVGGLPRYKASLDYREKHCPKPKMTETKQKKQADTHPKEMDNDISCSICSCPFSSLSGYTARSD